MTKVFICFAIFCVFLSAGCSGKEKPAISIGTIQITASEFEDAYLKTKVSRGTEISRKEFLDFLITRKLVLQEAEILGLDKDPQFLESLQSFWEQALLKLVLARKLNEWSLIGKVSEKEIETYYQRHKESDFPGKELSEVRGQIKALLFRIKQQLEIQRWTSSLKRNSSINIDYDLLQIPKDK
jgi:hypothetical protein